MWSVSSFYRFFPIPESDLESLKASLLRDMDAWGLLGLIIIATEGVNGTVAGKGDSIEQFKKKIASLTGDNETHFKDSVCEEAPFNYAAVNIRPEIVSLRRPELVPQSTHNHHLTPAQWKEFLNSDQPHILVDTRNDYEASIGTFPGAIVPPIRAFSEWGSFLESQELPKDVPVLIFCTGGIRCEKAILQMQEQGFDKVYQLQNGILGYLEEFPNEGFEGECYVFDHRVAVDQELKPTTKYGTCPSTGHPTDNWKTCAWCGETYAILPTEEEKYGPVCSRTCRDRYRRHGARVSAQTTKEPGRMS